MLNIKPLAMNKLQLHTCAIRKLLYGLCVSTGDNRIAKARELSSRTHAQTIQLLTITRTYQMKQTTFLLFLNNTLILDSNNTVKSPLSNLHLLKVLTDQS